MIDSHAHIYAEAFLEDIDATIARAKQVGIQHILLPNIDSTSIAGINELVTRDGTFFKRMMGLHPCSVAASYKEELSQIKHELDTQACIAVGEIGIDLYWDKTFQKQQEEAFLIQCEWAAQAQLPIVIHSRESTDVIIKILNVHYPDKLRGVFHCFVGNKNQAETILEMGFYLGIGGVVTFRNSELRNELKGLPLDRILIETDSPYLAPVPYRGKRNESSYIIEVVKELATIFNVSESEIKYITTQNALKLFKI
jgi:TatD DNase family protein